MRSSPGFGSSPHNHKRPIKARFHYASGARHSLSGCADLTRWLVLQKARRHRRLAPRLRLFVSIWFQNYFISLTGMLFHLSLTVLVHYRAQAIFSLGSSVLPASDGISPVPPYLRTHASECFLFVYGAFTRSGRPFQERSTKKTCRTPIDRVHTPRNPHGQAHRFRLFRVRSPLLTESLLMSFPPATKMFQFAGYASPPYVFRRVIPVLRQVGCPIRRSPDHSLFGSSPRLIAAYYALHRLLESRHPPYALVTYLTSVRKHPMEEMLTDERLAVDNNRVIINYIYRFFIACFDLL
jgi:hypothetical protein